MGFLFRLSSEGISVSPEVLGILVPVLFGVSAIVTLVVFFVFPKFARPLGRRSVTSGTKSASPFVGYSLVRWATAESPAIFGFVLLMLGARWSYVGALLFWGMLLIAMTPPTAAAKRTFDELVKENID